MPFSLLFPLRLVIVPQPITALLVVTGRRPAAPSLLVTQPSPGRRPRSWSVSTTRPIVLIVTRCPTSFLASAFLLLTLSFSATLLLVLLFTRRIILGAWSSGTSSARPCRCTCRGLYGICSCGICSSWTKTSENPNDVSVGRIIFTDENYSAMERASASASFTLRISSALSASVSALSLLYQWTSLFFCHLPVGALILWPR